MAITENSGINSTGEAIEFSDTTLSSIFNFVDNTLSALSIVDVSVQNTYKEKLQKGIGYSVRGSTANLLPSNSPKSMAGSKISVSVVKLNLDGFDTTVSTTFTSQDGNNVTVRIPKTALGSRKYTQISAIFTSDLVYNVITVNSGSSIKTGMLKLILDDTDSTMNIASTKVKASQITIANLTTPIEIDIPFSGSIGEDNTLACGYTLQANDVISSTGITTIIHSNYCTCQTTHLTDFMLEEYRETRNVDTVVNEKPKSVNKLRVERSAAFWLSLIMIIALPFFLFFGYKLDKKDIAKFGPEGPPGIKYYALVMVVWLSVRSKEKAELEKQDTKFEEDANDPNDHSNVNISYATGNNLSMSDMNMIRNRVTVPVVSNLEDDDDFEREESKEDKIQINDQRAAGIDHIQIGVLEKVDENEDEEKEDNSPEKMRNPNVIQEPISIKNIQEIEDEPVVNNIFEQQEPAPQPTIEVDTGEVADEEQQKIQKQLRKKRKKKKKPKVTSNFVEDNISAAEQIEKAESTISKGHKITFDSSKLNKIKRETRYSDDEFEGGEGDAEGNDTTNTADMNTGNAMHDHGLSASEMNVIDSAIHPKKKKKKIIKKIKKKKRNTNKEEDKNDDKTLYFDATDDIPVPFEPKVESKKNSRALSSVRDSISDNESKVENLETVDNQVSLDPNHIPITLDDPKKVEEEKEKNKEYVYHEKSEERHYDGKFFCRSMKYANRFSNMIIFYDERNPRIHRMLIVFNSCFIILFLSGAFFISSGDTNSVNDHGPLACFGISIFCTIMDWFMYILMYFLFLHKPRHYKNQKYMIEQNMHQLDQTNEDITEIGRSRLGSSQSGRKENNLDEDKKKKDMNRMVTFLAFIFSAALILTCWVFIIIMASKYSLKAGNLWALTILFTIVLDFVIVESFLIYRSSVHVYNKQLDLREQKFHPVPEEKPKNKISSKRYDNIQ